MVEIGPSDVHPAPSVAFRPLPAVWDTQTSQQQLGQDITMNGAHSVPFPPQDAEGLAGNAQITQMPNSEVDEVGYT